MRHFCVNSSSLLAGTNHRLRTVITARAPTVSPRQGYRKMPDMSRKTGLGGCTGCRALHRGSRLLEKEPAGKGSPNAGLRVRPFPPKNVPDDGANEKTPDCVRKNPAECERRYRSKYPNRTDAGKRLGIGGPAETDGHG